MRNPWTDHAEGVPRSLACLRDRHDDCPHLCGVGGGLNPRRFRFEFGVMVCKCACHSSCPISGSRLAVPERTWRETCTCPGADPERTRRAWARTEMPEFREFMAQSEQRSHARKEAFDAAQANAAGKSREQIRELYEAELRARGLKIPPEALLDAQVDAITGDYGPLMRLMGRQAGNVARSIRDIFRLFSGK
jgi:hypothetical protein